MTTTRLTGIDVLRSQYEVLRASPTSQDPVVAAHLDAAATSLTAAAAAQAGDPDNGTDPDDTAVSSHLAAAQAALAAAQSAQAIDGSWDVMSNDGPSNLAPGATDPDAAEEYVGDDMRSKVPSGTLVERSVGLAPTSSGDGRTLEGYAAVFGERAEVNNPIEGHFFESIQRGAFAKTISDGKMPALLFDHGQHAALGRLPIGKIESMREDERGLFVSARLTDSPAVEPIRAAIADGAIAGMSVRMRIVKEGWAPPAKGSRIAERSIKEVGLVELGPTAFPVYESTTASTRSAGTDTEAGSTGTPAATTSTAVGRTADLSSFRMRAKAILAGALDPIED